jgi:hypothetical protein
MGLAILPVNSELVTMVRNALPPEHRILGEQPEDCLGRIHLLIEGASLPDSGFSEMPVTVSMGFMADASEWRAYWMHAPDVSWPVPRPGQLLE